MHWFLVCVTITSVLGSWTNQDVAININQPYAFIGDSGIKIRCEAIGTKIRDAEWMMILLEGHLYERPLVNMVRKQGTTGHVFEWGDEFNVTDLQHRMTINGSMEGLVFIELEIHFAKIEDGGRYTCNYGGLDANHQMLEYHESEDFFVQYHIVQSNITGALTPNKDVLITINMLSAYVGESGLRIRCESPGNVIKEPKWLSIMIEGHRYQSPLAYMFKTINGSRDEFEWSEEFNITDLQKRIAYSGDLSSSNAFMELQFKEIRCEDSGRYTCLFNGLDSSGNVTQYYSSGDFVVKSLNGQPAIKDRKDHLVPNNTVYHMTPGDNVMFTCEGITGKPRIPILWVESNGTAQRVLKGEDGVTAGLEIIPDDDLCRFHSQVHLYYTMPSTPVTLTCKIAFSTTQIELIPPGYHHVPKSTASHTKPPHPGAHTTTTTPTTSTTKSTMIIMSTKTSPTTTTTATTTTPLPTTTTPATTQLPTTTTQLPTTTTQLPTTTTPATAPLPTTNTPATTPIPTTNSPSTTPIPTTTTPATTPIPTTTQLPTTTTPLPTTTTPLPTTTTPTTTPIPTTTMPATTPLPTTNSPSTTPIPTTTTPATTPIPTTTTPLPTTTTPLPTTTTPTTTPIPTTNTPATTPIPTTTMPATTPIPTTTQLPTTTTPLPTTTTPATAPLPTTNTPATTPIPTTMTPATTQLPTTTTPLPTTTTPLPTTTTPTTTPIPTTNTPATTPIPTTTTPLPTTTTPLPTTTPATAPLPTTTTTPATTPIPTTTTPLPTTMTPAMTPLPTTPMPATTPIPTTTTPLPTTMTPAMTPLPTTTTPTTTPIPTTTTPLPTTTMPATTLLSSTTAITPLSTTKNQTTILNTTTISPTTLSTAFKTTQDITAAFLGYSKAQNSTTVKTRNSDGKSPLLNIFSSIKKRFKYGLNDDKKKYDSENSVAPLVS